MPLQLCYTTLDLVRAFKRSAESENKECYFSYLKKSLDEGMTLGLLICMEIANCCPQHPKVLDSESVYIIREELKSGES